MANYGDVALGLKSDWNRNNYEYQEQMQGTVGHEDGKADARLKSEPDKRHQFRFVDHLGTRAKQEISGLRMKGYEFVKNETWDKHEFLWEWDAEGFLVHDGQRLMARPEDKFTADQARRDGITHAAAQDQSADNELDNVPAGLIATDGEGKPRARKRKGI